MTATMSILGLYRADPSIFNYLKIPAELDPTVLQTELLAQCAELEVIYPDPTIMSEVLLRWSTAMLPIWQKLYETTQYDYDPISNYDRNESWKDTATGSSNTSTNGQGSRSDRTFRTGFNVSEGLQATGQSDGQDQSNSLTQSKGSSTSEHTGRVHGNIGVTTTQAMIREQRDVVQYNVYQKIINDFEDRFCLMIY